jgi:hypothetical protein
MNSDKLPDRGKILRETWVSPTDEAHGPSEAVSTPAANLGLGMNQMYSYE